MSENEYKYKRWGWGALIGLAAVIVISGIVMAFALSSPKPSTKSEETTVAAATNEEPKAEEKKTETKQETKKSMPVSNEKKPQGQIICDSIASGDCEKQGSNSGSTKNSGTTKNQSSASSSKNMPKTGPEDAILPVVMLAICGALISYNVVLTKKTA